MYPFSIYFTAYFISSITPLFSLYTLLAITVFRIEMYKEMTTKILFQFLIGNVYHVRRQLHFRKLRVNSLQVMYIYEQCKLCNISTCVNSLQVMYIENYYRKDSVDISKSVNSLQVMYIKHEIQICQCMEDVSIPYR